MPLRDWKKTSIILQFFIIKSIVPDWIILMIRLMKSYSIMFIKQYLTNLDSTDTAKCHNLSPRIGSSVFIITTQCSTKTKGKNMKFNNHQQPMWESHWENPLMKPVKTLWPDGSNKQYRESTGEISVPLCIIIGSIMNGFWYVDHPHKICLTSFSSHVEKELNIKIKNLTNTNPLRL